VEKWQCQTKPGLSSVFNAIEERVGTVGCSNLRGIWGK
jgi:hypothetical protein